MRCTLWLLSLLFTAQAWAATMVNGPWEGGSRMVEKSQVWNPDAPCISMYGIRTIMYHLNWVEWFGQMLGFIFQHIYLTKPSFF